MSRRRRYRRPPKTDPYDASFPRPKIDPNDMSIPWEVDDAPASITGAKPEGSMSALKEFTRDAWEDGRNVGQRQIIDDLKEAAQLSVRDVDKLYWMDVTYTDAPEGSHGLWKIKRLMHGMDVIGNVEWMDNAGPFYPHWRGNRHGAFGNLRVAMNFVVECELRAREKKKAAG